LHDGRLMKSLVFPIVLLLSAWLPAARADALEPFIATYQAYNEGKLAGNATMRLVHNADPQWRVDLGIHGNRGFAGILALNIEQSTVFDAIADHYRPLTQSTVRKALVFFGKKTVGVYDWSSRTARWRGDLKKDRTQPVPLRDGDMSGLLINLAVVRDAVPGRQLQYRFVDGGRVRDHLYQVAEQTENIKIGELSYEAMRVSRTNGGNDETILWVASGVPTPVRILQRTDGQDAVDLRLIEYQGTENP
jgi:hypothetical protein